MDLLTEFRRRCWDAREKGFAIDDFIFFSSSEEYEKLCEVALEMDNPGVLLQIVRYHPNLSLDFVKAFMERSSHINMDGVWREILNKLGLQAVLSCMPLNRYDRHYDSLLLAIVGHKCDRIEDRLRRKAKEDYIPSDISDMYPSFSF